MPLVSVIIPTCNQSDLVKETVQSVLAQTLGDFEVIVVDDGSTDDTRAIITGIQDARVKYFYKPNGGVSSARNYGLAKAIGEYVAFLDHDDLWPTNFLEVMVSHLAREREYGLVYCPITIIHENSKIEKSHNAEFCKSGWITVDLFQKSMVWTSTAVIRASALKNFCYDEALSGKYEDGDFYLRLSVRIPFLFIRKVEAIRREHTENLSRKIGVHPQRILVAERFYFNLGGYKIISRTIARRKISHACRKVAESHRLEGCRSAAICLYKRAIRYWPFDLRLYAGLVQGFLLNKTKDPNPDWKMPEPLHGK